MWSIMAACSCDYFSAVSICKILILCRNETQEDVLWVIFPVMNPLGIQRQFCDPKMVTRLLYVHCDIFFNMDQRYLPFYQFSSISKDEYYRKNIFSDLQLDIHSGHVMLSCCCICVWIQSNWLKSIHCSIHIVSNTRSRPIEETIIIQEIQFSNLTKHFISDY